MATRHEIYSLEHESTPKATLNPSAFSLENTGFHSNLHNFNSGEDVAFPFWSTRLVKENHVKASCTWKPVEDDSKKEQNDGRFYRTGETGAQQSRKALMTSNLRPMALFSEKENVDSGLSETKSGLSLSKPKAFIAQRKSSAGLLDLTTVKRSQEVLTKPLSQREMNVLDEGVGRPGVSIDRICAEDGRGLAAASVEGSQSLHLMGKHLEHTLEEISCYEQPLSILAQDRLQETSWGALSTSSASMKATPFSTESMKAPLLSEFEEKSESEILRDWLRPADPIASRLQTPCEKPRQCSETDNVPEIRCEERSPFEVPDCSMPSYSHHNTNTDHVVIFFSVQKFLEDNASRVNRQKLSKLASLCSLYSRKVMCWVTKKCTGQNIPNCLRCIRQIFSPSASRFTRLDSQKLPEFSTKTSSPSKKVLAKDNELRAVLLKINEVLASMETTS